MDNFKIINGYPVFTFYPKSMKEILDAQFLRAGRWIIK